MIHRAQDSLAILGVQVNVFHSYDDAVQLIRQRILLRQATSCIAISPEKIYRAKHDARLRHVLNAADIRLCDGVGVSLASTLLHHRSVPRCTGFDLFLRLVRLSAQEGWRIFLLGASPQSSKTAHRALVDAFPDLRIAGSQDGFFEDSAAVVERIKKSGADLLFVAMGSPRQEFWINEQMPRLGITFCMGIGGSLDVVSGTVKRAPALFRKTGTEWLFRTLLQPRQRIRRTMLLPLYAREILRAMGRD